MNYFLLLHIFSKQLVSMQDEGSLDSSSLKAFQNNLRLDVFVCYVLVVKRTIFKTNLCFESSWLLFMVSFIPMNVNKFKIPNILSKGESVKLLKV